MRAGAKTRADCTQTAWGRRWVVSEGKFKQEADLDGSGFEGVQADGLDCGEQGQDPGQPGRTGEARGPLRYAYILPPGGKKRDMRGATRRAAKYCTSAYTGAAGGGGDTTLAPNQDGSHRGRPTLFPCFFLLFGHRADTLAPARPGTRRPDPVPAATGTMNQPWIAQPTARPAGPAKGGHHGTTRTGTHRHQKSI